MLAPALHQGTGVKHLYNGRTRCATAAITLKEFNIYLRWLYRLNELNNDKSRDGLEEPENPKAGHQQAPSAEASYVKSNKKVIRPEPCFES